MRATYNADLQPTLGVSGRGGGRGVGAGAAGLCTLLHIPGRQLNSTGGKCNAGGCPHDGTKKKEKTVHPLIFQFAEKRAE